MTRNKKRMKARSDSPHRSKRTKQYKTPLDKISELPDCLLIKILSLLSTKESIATGALSKRWQYVWTSIPVLEFNSPYEYRTSTFVRIVNDALLLHDDSVKLTRFRVKTYFKIKYSKHVTRWLSHVTERNVEDLELIFKSDYYPDKYYVLPQFLYQNSSITKLALRDCSLEPCQSMHWKSLVSLSLTNVVLSMDLIRNILSGCPSLEVLEMYYCLALGGIEINSASLTKFIITSNHNYLGNLDILAPNIHSLEITGKYISKKLVIDMASFINLKLDIQYKLYEVDDCLVLMTELLQRVQHVRNITFGNWCVQAISVMEVKALPVPHLKHKSLTLDLWLYNWVLPGISRLLKSSPDLETLVLCMRRDYNPKECFFCQIGEIESKNYWTSKSETFMCLRTSVKTIEIINYEGGKLDTELVCFLLQRAEVLQKMVIRIKKETVCEDDSNPKTLETLATSILNFPRYSSDVVILVS